MRNSVYLAVINIFYLALLSAALFLFPLRVHAAHQHHQADAATMHAPDPDKESSEANHHIAGIFLIAIGLTVICSQYNSMAWLKWLVPVLFIAAGLFLAAWSDKEIWPRGNLNWLWLLQHDAEAGQHKLYALLLLIVGMVELIQTSTRFRRRWLAFIVPVLGLLGALSLFVHHHHSDPVAANGNAIHGLIQATAINFQGTNGPPNAAEINHAAHQHGSTPSSEQEGASPIPQEQHHAHVMTESGANIQREHAWFAVVGLCVVLFKFLHEVVRPAGRVPQSLWAGAMILLGVLLLLYTE